MNGAVQLADGQGRLRADEVSGEIECRMVPAWMAQPLSESVTGEMVWGGHPAWMADTVAARERWERRLGTAALVRNERRRR